MPPTDEDVLHAAIVRDPSDDVAWLALADHLEETGQRERAELLRLTRRLREVAWDAGERPALEARVVALLAAGVRPANPEVVNSVGMRFRLIPPGRFLMGAADDEEGGNDFERPRHEVTINQPFWLGTTPVTQAEYEAVMGMNPSYFSPTGGEHNAAKALDTRAFPVDGVSWDDAAELCRRLTEKDESGHRSRLPSEAEWEYACRGGCVSRYHFGNDLHCTQANFRLSRLARTCVVASYPANSFGLYDTHGNVWEWCSNRFEGGYQGASPTSDLLGFPPGYERVMRGGDFNAKPEYCRAAYRRRCSPDGFVGRGLRLARVPVR